MSPVDLTHPERPKKSEMTGAEMKAIRQRLGLSTVQLGRAFGYAGADDTASVTIRKYEATGENARPIPPWLSRLLIMFDRHGVPPEFLKGPE